MAETRDSRSWALIALLLLSLLLRLYLFLDISYSADDALITFRYADNLAAGRGFVYNEGEHVLGTTTPFFTLCLAAFLKLGCSPFWSAFLMNTAADFLTAFVLWTLFSATSASIRWIPAALFLFSPETIQWSLSGMETELSIACLFAAFFFAARDSWKSACIAAALATLVRIDGAAALVALTAAHVARRGKLPVMGMILAAVVLLPWTLFAFRYFGSPIPNSAAAKWALSGQNLLTAAATILLKGFLHLHTFGLPLLVLALAGTYKMVRERKEWLALVFWTWGYALSYALAAGPMHPWYYTPFYAGYLALVWAGCVVLAERIPFRWAPAAAGLIAIIVVLTMSYYRTMTMRDDQQGTNALNGRVGLWLAANAPPGAVVGLKDIGFSGYYSGRRVLDLAGLVSPESIPYRARGDFLGPILAFHPDFFAFSKGQVQHLDLEGRGVLKQYRPAAEIQVGSGAYIIYRLR